MAALYSMTGFAQAQRSRGDCRLALSLRAVNHRFLDLRWQLPAELEPVQPELEKQLRAALARGHIDVRCQCELPAAALAPRLDPVALDSYLNVCRQVQHQLGTSDLPSIADVLRAPGVWATSSAAPVATEIWASLAREALGAALADLNRMRATEGAALAADLRTRLDHMDAARLAIQDLRLELESGLRERLELRLRELLGAAAPDSARVLQEAALQADRSDISEELTRLQAHITQARALLAGGGEVGKKLDFLTQELNREVNTLLSKTTSGSPAGLQVSEIGVGLKAELEKFREQVQNLV